MDSSTWIKPVIWTICILLAPATMFILPSVSGDGGYIPSYNFLVYEPGQNAIICWNGTHERMYLSVNILAEAQTDGMHVVPFPSLPMVESSNITVFSNMSRIMNSHMKPYGMDNQNGDHGSGDGAMGGADSGIVIEYSKTVGVHNISVIHVIDPKDFKEQIVDILSQLKIPIEKWPEGMDDLIGRYLSRNISFFALDRFPISPDKRSINPLVYDFKTPNPIFPLEISSLLQGTSTITLSLISPSDLPIDLSLGGSKIRYVTEVVLGREDLETIDIGMSKMFNGNCLGSFFSSMVYLPFLNGDFIIERRTDVDWMVSTESMETIQARSGTGLTRERMVLYSQHPNVGSWAVSCSDRASGKLVWEVVLDHPSDREVMSRYVLKQESDSGQFDDVIVMDYTEGSSLTKIDGDDGSIKWKSTFPETGEEHIHYNPYVHWWIRNGEGKDLLMVPNIENNDLLIIDPGNGALVRKLTDIEGYNREYLYDVTIFAHANGDHIFSIRSSSTAQFWDPWNGNGTISWTMTNVLDSLKFKGMGREMLLAERTNNIQVLEPFYGLLMGQWDSKGQRIISRLYPTGDSDHDGNDEAISWGTDAGFEWSDLKKVCLMNGSSIWKEEVWVLGWYEDLFLSDMDSDGTEDILLKIYPSYSYDFRIVIINGLTGERMETNVKSYTYLGHGSDLDGNGLREVVMENNGFVIAVEPSGGRTVLVAMKENLSEDLIGSCTIDYDMDGGEDLVLNGQNGVRILDGSTGDLLGEAKHPGSRWVKVTPLERTNGKNGLILMSGFRYYSITSPISIEIGSDRSDLAKGMNTTLFAYIAHKGVPVSGATVTWGPIGQFTEVREVIPGTYSTVWTPPKGFTGKALITATVLKNGLPRASSYIEVNVWDGYEVRPSPSMSLIVDPLVLDDDVLVGSVVNFIVKVEADDLAHAPDVVLIDPKDPLTNRTFFSISKNLWGLSIDSGKEPGTRYVLLKVLYEQVLLWEGFLSFKVCSDPGMTLPDGPPPHSLLCIACPEVVAPMETSTIVISYDGGGDGGLFNLRGSDDKAGGDFQSIQRYGPGLWKVVYRAPSRTMSINLTFFLWRNGEIADSCWMRIQVVEKEVLGFLEVPLDIKYQVAAQVPTQSNIFDVNLAAYYEGIQVTGLSYKLLGSPPNWTLEFLEENLDGSLDFLLYRPEIVEGSLDILVYDGLGKGGVVHINIPAEGPPMDQDGSGEKSTGPLKEDDGPDRSVIISVILLLASITVSLTALALLNIRLWKSSNEVKSAGPYRSRERSSEVHRVLP